VHRPRHNDTTNVCKPGDELNCLSTLCKKYQTGDAGARDDMLQAQR
jgi:hypothetical protein